MLYPTNIKVEHKKNTQIIKEKIKDLNNGIKRRFKYLICDRSNLGEKIAIKKHN